MTALFLVVVLLLLVVGCMVYRDGKNYFTDFLKVAVLVLSILLAFLLFLPLRTR